MRLGSAFWVRTGACVDVENGRSRHSHGERQGAGGGARGLRASGSYLLTDTAIASGKAMIICMIFNVLMTRFALKIRSHGCNAYTHADQQDLVKQILTRNIFALVTMRIEAAKNMRLDLCDWIEIHLSDIFVNVSSVMNT